MNDDREPVSKNNDDFDLKEFERTLEVDPVQMADAVKTAEWTVPTKGAPFPPGGPAPL
jgi:hypothetical protein